MEWQLKSQVATAPGFDLLAAAKKAAPDRIFDLSTARSVEAGDVPSHHLVAEVVGRDHSEAVSTPMGECAAPVQGGAG